MKMLGQLAVVGLIAGAVALGYAYKDELPFLSKKSGQPAAVSGGQQARALPVEVVGVRQMDVNRTIEAIGTAQSNEAITVTAKGAGTVERVLFQEGQRVRVGTVLVELEAAESSAKLAELRAARDAARQAYDRAAQLLESRSVAQARADDLQKAVEGAEARLRAEQAKFADSVIRAPFSGKLGLRRVSVGALVRPGDPITTLDDTTTIKLEFDVPEIALGGVAEGNVIQATAAALPGRRFDGKVATIDSRIDPISRSVKVRALIPNPDDVLKPGMFMTVQLNVGRSANALVVPEESVLAQGGEQFVFVVGSNNRAVRTRITLGQRGEGFVEVVRGLAADSRVAVTGLQQLRDGMPVRPTEPAPPAAAKPAG